MKQTKYTGPAKPIPLKRRDASSLWFVVVAIAAVAVVALDVLVWRV